MGQDGAPIPGGDVVRLKGRQARFLIGSLGTWTGARTALLWTGTGTVAGVMVGGLASGPSLPWPRAVAAAPFRPPALQAHAAIRAAPDPAARPLPPMALLWRASSEQPAQFLYLAMARYNPGGAQALLRHAVFAAPPPGEDGDAAPLTSQALATPHPNSRWSGSAYVFVRPGSGAASLAAGGQLGGSQTAARLAYQLNRDAPVRTAIAARLYAPLASRGAEAAVGLDWHPLPAVPLRVSVERRFDLDGAGRSAWSAYAAGGFYLERLGGRVALDGYAQAGVVGLERRDLFVDGALRAGRRFPIGSAKATLGAGLWGAAQPGVARLDAGPRVAVVLPVARHDVSLAVEGRLRVAGRARPGSGAAMTLGFDL